jgi:hypothetical protein
MTSASDPPGIGENCLPVLLSRAQVASTGSFPGLLHVAKNSVIPTEAERSEAQRRDLFYCLRDKMRSLDYAARWAASLGMTE